MSLSSALLSAVSGLQTAQAQLQITSNNIANVNTLGYTRKSAQSQTLVTDGSVSGVRLSELQRTVDDHLLRQLREHIARLSGQTVESQYLERTQVLFGSVADNGSLSHSITALGSAFEAFAIGPESLISRDSVVAAARRLTDQLQFLSNDIQGMRLAADRQITQSIDTINDALAEIHDLNQDIVRANASMSPAPDLEDRRDTLLNRLAEEVDIQYFTRPTGEVVISTRSGRLLLDSVPASLSYSPVSQIGASTTLGTGLDGIILDPSGTDITQEISGGQLGGLLRVRDEILVDLQAEIDRLAEVMHDQINALHNDGSAYPPPAALTGTRSVSTSDAPSMSGNFRVTVTGADGVVLETVDIDLGALAPPNIGQLVTQINGMTNASASINASGQVTIVAAGGSHIAVNELDSAVSSGNATYGMAQFLGLNDVFVSGTDYGQYLSDRTVSDTAALGLVGTLLFNIAGATANVAYAAGDSLADIAANISAMLGGNNITATVVREGDGFRLDIADADGDNFFVSDSGSLTTQLNLRAGAAGTAQRIAVRDALLQNTGLLAQAELTDGPGLAAGDIAFSIGSTSIARALAAVFTSDHVFTASGGLAQSTTNLAEYAAQILAVNASQANSLANEVSAGESFRMALETQAAAVSQVNLDEEMANIIILQNAYAASARLTAAISAMMDELLDIV